MSGFLGFDILWPVPSKQIMVRFWIVLLISGLPFGMPQVYPSLCNNANYTKGSAFERNLNTVLDRLVHNGSLAGFNTSFYGQTPSTVYGLLQCRGDISPSDCFNCSQDADRSVRQQCGKAVGGRVWLELCYLRYENYRFFSRLDAQPYYTIYNTIKITNPDVFRNATLNLLDYLAYTAAYDPDSKRFAQHTIYYSPSRSLFGMVQCWRDLGDNDCKECLSSATSVLNHYFQQEGARTLLGSCTVRYELYPFSVNYGPPPPVAEAPIATVGFNPNPPKTPPSKKNSPEKLPIILGAVGVVLLALLLLICLFTIRISKVKFRKSVVLTHNQGHEDSDFLLGQQQIVMFDLETLTAATDNFHERNKLGQGGFGPVYRGITSDGREIAVKKLSARFGQGQREFMNEVKVVAQIQHRNLVKLLGCCAQESERSLVYEYLPNKSLDATLFDKERGRHLDWQQRYAIILGIARGLLYLHHDSQLKIIHRDIKASNILLDDKLIPKISDFGLARIVAEDDSHVSTRVAGTFGYMAPEYAMQGQLSIKSDVYSFGVLLLEIVSGRKNTDLTVPPEKQNLLGWAWKLHKRGDTQEMIDPALNIQAGILQEQALRCIHVGLLCTQAQAAIRPQFSEIIAMLSNSTVTLQDPKKPAFLGVTEIRNSIISSNSGLNDRQREALSRTSATTSSGSSNASSQRSNLVPFSRNEASISDIDPR